MLIELENDHVIKSDRYCFMLCHNKGLTKFPGGESIYFKPFSYHSRLNHVKSELDSFLGLVKAEEDFFAFVKSLTYEVDKTVTIFGYKVKPDKDCFVVQIGSGYNLYTPLFADAFIACWTHYLREDEKFGSNKNSDIQYGSVADILKEIETAKALIKSFSTDSSVG